MCMDHMTSETNWRTRIYRTTYKLRYISGMTDCLRTSASERPIVPTSDNTRVWNAGGIILRRKHWCRLNWTKHALVSLQVRQMPLTLTWKWTPIFVLEGCDCVSYSTTLSLNVTKAWLKKKLGKLTHYVIILRISIAFIWPISKQKKKKLQKLKQ